MAVCEIWTVNGSLLPVIILIRVRFHISPVNANILVKMTPPFEWVGGHPALDFCNTVSWGRNGRHTEERLVRPEDLAVWAARAHLLPGGPRSRRRRASVREVHATRATLHSLFSRLARGRPPDRAIVRSFQRRLGRALGSLAIAPRRGELALVPTRGRASWNPALVQVVWSAAQLATSPEAARIRLCANEACGWLFIDRSRRRNRRWCDMRVCGSRAKARRYYARRVARRRRSRRSARK